MHPPIEPYDHGMLEVGDDNQVYWETCGNPDGKPALVVHGGPGAGCSASQRRSFDPAAYRAILFDPRGCARSRPHARDPATDMAVNTTDRLIEDMELLREHLGVERWLLYGGSWGSTLSLASAERHPERVSEIVLVAVTTTRRSEVDWLYRGVGRFFPEALERFRAAVPEAESDATPDVLAAYARRMDNPDPDVRARAAHEWLAWEDAVISLESEGHPGAYSDRPPDAALAFVRICARYFANGAFLDEGAILRDAGRLAGIPGVLIHGRLDLGGPLVAAWELGRAWPDAELHVIEDSGHTAGPEMAAATGRASERSGRS